jgi:gliding motility-associated transport system permease protein
MADTAVTLGAAAAREERAGVGATRTGFSFGRMFAVMRKELRSYFAFPLVYIIGGIFLLLAGWYAYTDLKFFITISFSRDIIQNYWTLLFTDIRLGLLMTIPFITMRQFAEERKLGTVELLYTYPLRDSEILGGKFLASVVIFLLMLGLTSLYPIFIYSIHSFALFPMLSGYVGLVLLGCAFIACGLFISSLCESQVIAGIATIVLLFLLWILNWNESAFQSGTLDVLRMLSLFDQFNGFAKGVIELYSVTYFIFFTTFFLFLTMRSMEARKWTGRR